MISIDDAFAHLDDQIGPLPARRLPLRESLGRVLAEDAFARIDLPPFRQGPSVVPFSPLVRSFVPSFLRLFARSLLAHSFVHELVRSFAPAVVQTFVHR